MASAIIFLAKETGWSEKEILDLPVQRINTYLGLLNDFYRD